MAQKKSRTVLPPTTPWRRRTADGIYFTHHGAVWAYFELPLAPLKWEDGDQRLMRGGDLDGLLSELGDTSVDVANGLAALAALREVQIFAASFETTLDLPNTTTAAHEEFLSQVLPAATASKTLLVGVKLWNQVKRGMARGGSGSGLSGVWKQTKTVLSRDLDSEDSFAPYKDDHAEISDIMRRHNGMRPREEALAQLESWFNLGNGPDAPVLAGTTSLDVTHGGTWEIATVTEFERATLSAPHSTWLMDAMTHADPAVVVSIRGELMPPTLLRAQLRASQRKLRAAEEEEAKTGDISRDEIGDRAQLAKDLENRVIAEGRAWLSKASILMAREYNPHEDQSNTYRDMLRGSYGIETKPLEHRQLKALEEMLPGGNVRANPFDQTISIPMIAYAGLPSFSNIGDPGPLWLGEVDPDYAPVFIDSEGAPNNDKPPVMAIFGDPGSGKASALTAKIATPTGWTLMGDICVGDEIIGSDGLEHLVTGVFPQGIKPIYRVRFSDGASTEVTGDHLWSVAPTSRPGDGNWLVKTTDDLRKTLHGGQVSWRIPMVAPVRRNRVDVPVDPYLVGVLLAAGEYTVGPDRDTTTPPPADAIGAAGIPGSYQLGSIDQRFALLQGLLDGDPAPVPYRGLAFTAESRKLADDVIELVQSLGGTAHTRPARTPEHAGAWQVRLTVPETLGAPYRLPSKVASWDPTHAAAPARTITEITHVRDDHAQCISVSANDRLYVTDDYIVTHNTFVAQLIAGQAALSSTQTIVINPKGFSSLKSFADWVTEFGVPSNRVALSTMETQDGPFDPFRFAPPAMAAEILNRHILTVLGVEHAGGLTGPQEIALGEGLVRGAEAGARCAYDALQYVSDPEVINLVVSQARASSVFRLGFGYTPQPAFSTQGSGLTLIEFDRNLPFPEPGMPPGREERIAVAAMRLVTRAAMEILMAAGGGVLVVDEAHHYLNSPEGLASLQRLGREGRSLGLMPVFLTQRVSDLLGAEMENYLSRVLVMKLTDAVQAEAALRLCGLKPTKARIELLREVGPRPPSNGMPGQASRGLFRDIYDRHAMVTIGPIPEDIRLAFSTNPADAKKRQELLAQRVSTFIEEATP